MAEAFYGSFKDSIFKNAVRFLQKRRVLAKEEYRMLDSEARAKAFTVSGYTALEVLQEFSDALAKAVEEGKTKEEFREKMDSFLAERGMDAVNPWKSDTIFRTNVQTAYNAGHYKSMTGPETLRLRPYWQYRTAYDDRVRADHAVMHGAVYRADDPIWDIWYPPNGFRCRCTVVSLSKRQVEERGLRVERLPPRTVDTETGEILMLMPDKGFAMNPAKATYKPDLSHIDPVLRRVQQSHEARPLQKIEKAGVKVWEGVKKLDQKAVNETLQAVTDILEDFKLPMTTLNGINTTDKGMASANGFKDLGLNPEHYKSYRKKFYDDYTVGGNRYYSIGAHEMGHIVARVLTEKKFSGESILTVATKWKKHTLQKEVVRETAKKFKGDTFISEYGNTNVSELLSEAFADVYLNREQAKEYSKELVQTTKRLLDKYSKEAKR